MNKHFMSGHSEQNYQTIAYKPYFLLTNVTLTAIQLNYNYFIYFSDIENVFQEK